MIINGIKAPRIRIPKALRALRVRDWPGALALREPSAWSNDGPRAKNARLVWKLAGAAIRRWSLLPNDAYEHTRERDTAPSEFEASRQKAVNALERLGVGLTGAGLTIDDLIGWAQIEVDFQERLPPRWDPEQTELAKRDWTQ